MSKMNGVYVAKTIHFRPYAETGEFACIGVVMYSLVTGYFDYRLSIGRQFRRVKTRISSFFPEIPTTIFRNSQEYIETELKKVKKLSCERDLFLSPELAIRNLCRDRENVICFGPSSVLSCDDPRAAIENLFDKIVMRGFVDVAQAYVRKMEISIKEKFEKASIKFRREEIPLKYEGARVVLPFYFGEKVDKRAIKPMDMRKSVPEVIADSLKWKFHARSIQEMRSGISILCPTRYPDKGTAAYDAVNDIIGHDDSFEMCQYDDTTESSRLVSFVVSA